MKAPKIVLESSSELSLESMVKTPAPVTVAGQKMSLVAKKRKGMFDVFLTAAGRSQVISRSNKASATIGSVVDRVNSF